MIVALIVSLLAVFGYTAYAVKKCGIPTSLSETYYLLEEKGLWNGSFTISLFSGSLLALVPLIEVSGNVQFLAFIMCASTMFIALAPQFVSPSENRIYYIATGIAAFSAVIWSIFVFPYSWIATVVALGATIFLSVKKPQSWMFWGEISVFAMVYIVSFLAMIFR